MSVEKIKKNEEQEPKVLVRTGENQSCFLFFYFMDFYLKKLGTKIKKQKEKNLLKK